MRRDDSVVLLEVDCALQVHDLSGSVRGVPIKVSE